MLWIAETDFYDCKYHFRKRWGFIDHLIFLGSHHLILRTELLMCFYLDVCFMYLHYYTCKFKDKGSINIFLGWATPLLKGRLWFVKKKTAFKIWGLFSHKLAQIRDNCSFIQLFYLDLNDIYMLKIWECNDRDQGDTSIYTSAGCDVYQGVIFQHKSLNQVFLFHMVFLKVNKHNIPFKDCVAILWLNNSLARLHEQDCPNSWKV